MITPKAEQFLLNMAMVQHKVPPLYGDLLSSTDVSSRRLRGGMGDDQLEEVISSFGEEDRAAQAAPRPWWIKGLSEPTAGVNQQTAPRFVNVELPNRVINVCYIHNINI